MSQIIYILTNPHMPQLALIGYFDVGTVEKEMQRLYSEGVPDFFECEYTAEVVDAEKIKNDIYKKFAKEFVHYNRGFFNKESIGPIKEFIKKHEIKRKYKQESSKDFRFKPTRKRGPNFTFEEVGIKRGGRLVYRDDEKIKCFVDDKKTAVVLWIEEEPSYLLLSAATEEVCKFRNEVTESGAYQGVRYWKYKGELLIDLWEKSKRQ